MTNDTWSHGSWKIICGYMGTWHVHWRAIEVNQLLFFVFLPSFFTAEQNQKVAVVLNKKQNVEFKIE